MRRYCDRQQAFSVSEVRQIQREIAIQLEQHNFAANTAPFEVDWTRIAEALSSKRLPETLRIAYSNYYDSRINHTRWTDDERARLQRILDGDSNGRAQWIRVAAKLNTNRTPLDVCRQVQHAANAALLRREWSAADDVALVAAVRRFGDSDWTAVARTLTRSPSQCLHRYCKTVRAQIIRGRWSAAETLRLRLAVVAHSGNADETDVANVGKWNRVAAHCRGRTDVKCRERFVNFHWKDNARTAAKMRAKQIALRRKTAERRAASVTAEAAADEPIEPPPYQNQHVASALQR